MQTIDRSDPSICCVCSRRAVGHGITKGPDERILWCCDDLTCLSIARDTYHMKQEEFTRIESLAAGEGGVVAGQYLESLGKTDLADLTEFEWHEFCRKLVGGYRVAMATTLKNEAPF